MKIWFSVPDELFEAGERARKRLGLARNRLYVTALRRHLIASRDAEVTARLNRIYAKQRSGIEPGVLRAQLVGVPDETW